MSYLPPDRNPKCECAKTHANPFFCVYGHLTECHYPLECEDAQCSHWEDSQDEEPLDIDDSSWEKKTK